MEENKVITQEVLEDLIAYCVVCDNRLKGQVTSDEGTDEGRMCRVKDICNEALVKVRDDIGMTNRDVCSIVEENAYLKTILLDYLKHFAYIWQEANEIVNKTAEDKDENLRIIKSLTDGKFNDFVAKLMTPFKIRERTADNGFVDNFVDEEYPASLKWFLLELPYRDDVHHYGNILVIYGNKGDIEVSDLIAVYDENGIHGVEMSDDGTLNVVENFDGIAPYISESVTEISYYRNGEYGKWYWELKLGLFDGEVEGLVETDKY